MPDYLENEQKNQYRYVYSDLQLNIRTLDEVFQKNKKVMNVPF